MRVLLTSLNLKQGFNPVVNRLFSPLEGGIRFTTEVAGDAPDAIFLSFIAPPCDFELDSFGLNKLLGTHVPVVVFDHTETLPANFLLGSELPKDHPYHALSSSVACMDVRAYFKRELLAEVPVRKAAYPVYPVEWPVPQLKDFDGLDTETRYHSRPIDLLMSWGYSSLSRPRLFGELMRRFAQFNAHFCLDEEDLERALEEKRERIFALLFSPYYRRIPFEKIMAWQQRAKVSVSLKGAGYKCFRQAEASYNAVLAQQSPGLVSWGFPWVDGQNCIGLPNTSDGEIDEVAAVDKLYQWLRIKQGSLYPMYVQAMLTNRNYHMDAYSSEYLLPKLLEALK